MILHCRTIAARELYNDDPALPHHCCAGLYNGRAALPHHCCRTIAAAPSLCGSSTTVRSKTFETACHKRHKRHKRNNVTNVTNVTIQTCHGTPYKIDIPLLQPAPPLRRHLVAVERRAATQQRIHVPTHPNRY
jgi:hypothetical protein